MKFWHKTLLLVLILFIAALDVSVLMMMNRSLQMSLQRETERAASDQTLIANNIYENLNSIESRGTRVTGQMLLEVASSYADYYKQQDIGIQLWDGDRLLYPAETAAQQKPQLLYEQLEIDGVRYIRSSNLLPAPYNNLLLVYQRNIEELYVQQNELNRLFVGINFTVGPFLVLVLFLMIRQLTRPLSQLTATTRDIAAGNYAERVHIRSNDEFGELARSFNQMTEAVEQHVTELSEMAAQKQRIVDNLAHELRTPLTGMLGFAEYLNAANIGEEDRRTASQYILSETVRLKNLAFKLLELSAVGHQVLKPGSVNVQALFQAVRQTESAQLKHAELTLVQELSIERVWGDPDLLASWLINCIDNAVHASPAGAEIRLLAYEEDAAAVLEVRDCGTGMTPEQVERAFEPFYRADQARSREHGGAGLGLSLCRQIADAHGARLVLESVKHQGTRIRIFLQLHNN